MIDYKVLLAAVEDRAPSFVHNNLNYMCLMGSQAYGCAEATSDVDVYGFCTPDFNALVGFPGPKFEQFNPDHVDSAYGDADYNIFNVIKYFSMLVNNNPNIIDSLFVPESCVLFADDLAREMRSLNYLFISKRLVKNTLSYADSEFKVIQKRGRAEKRADLYDKYGYDTKTAYHCLRLLTQAEQALTQGTIFLDENGDEYRKIRNGLYSYEDFINRVQKYRDYIESILPDSNLQKDPNMERITKLFNDFVRPQYAYP